MGPALIVIGIVAVITIGGGVLATLGSGPKPAPASLAAPPGLSLGAASASSFLGPITSMGQPPVDIASSLVVPAGSRLGAHGLDAADLGLYDGHVGFTVPASATTVVTFYRYELAHNGWRISLVAASADGHGTNLYAEKDSSDGYQWEIEVGVTEDNGSISSALGGASPSSASSVALRLIERDDLD
jgi:hypothetical protein